MKIWIIRSLFLFAGFVAFADPLVLVNTLSYRPVFTMVSSGVTQTRFVAPGERINLDAGLFSGLGDKKVPLAGGSIYYLARLGGSPRIYRLPSDQALILNQSGRPISLHLVGQSTADGFLASGALALGALDQQQNLTADWDDGTGQKQTLALTGGKVYRLVLDSPEGVGTTVSLLPWN